MIAAFVIAGGQSSRMGRDKALLQLDGETLLERTLALARGVTDNVKIVGRRRLFNSAIPQFGNSAIIHAIDVIEDLYPGQGPLAGIHAALTSSAAELNLMIAVDTPFLDARFLRYLVEQAQASEAVVTVPVTRNSQWPVAGGQKSGTSSPDHPLTRSPDVSDLRISAEISGKVVSEQYQPLCAVYRREFAAIAETALREQRNNIVPLFRRVTTREIGDEELRQLAFDPRMFDNLNTPEEWDRARRRNAE